MYDIEALIFNGGAGGEVYRARARGAPPDAPRVAVKVPRPAKGNELAALRREIDLLRAVNGCKYIVQMLGAYDVTDADGNTMPYLVMEHSDGADLIRTLITRSERRARANPSPMPQLMSDEEARVATWRVLKALQFLHDETKICHRDVKADNILLVRLLSEADCDRHGLPRLWAGVGDARSAKLADFGHSRLNIGSSPLTSHIGTACYNAPELVKMKSGVAGADHYKGKPVDMWAAGVTVLSMLAEYTPFLVKAADDSAASKQQSMLATYRNILNYQGLSAVDCARLAQRPAAAVALVNALLSIQPDARPSASQALQSAWFSGMTDDE